MSGERAAQLITDALAGFRPPPRLTLSEWADANFYLSPESSAEAGRWHTIPYQREPMDCVTDPLVERITWMKSSRVGFTKILNCTAGYYIEHDPCPLMIVQPTEDDAEGYSKEEIAPMLRDVPVLQGLVRDAVAKDTTNTILRKTFPGGSLSLVGANSPRGFRRVSRKVVMFDEVDGYPPSAGVEGDQIKLGIRRTEYYWDRKIIAGSTPTIAGISRIEAMFEDGDQRRYYVPCPHCGLFQVLKFPRFKWPEGQPEKAEYICEGCEQAISHDHKRDMVAAGEWRAAKPFNGHASFHIWAAYSYSPNASWGQICAEFVDAKRGSVEELKTFVNTVLGETWTERGEAPDWRRLYERRERYKQGTVPAGGRMLTCGVDVQKDRLVWEVVAWGPGRETWSVDQGVFPGDTAAAEGWAALDALLARPFRHESGVDMHIAFMAVDSGYNTQVVYTWCRGKSMARIGAVKGVESASVMVSHPSPVDITINGRKLRRGYKVWPIGVNLAKSELYGWLRLDRPTVESGAPFPPGYCHFPEYGEDFFKQLTAEQLVVHRKRTGHTKMEWELMVGRENHALDCRVYARAAAAILGIDRYRERDWARLMGLPPAVQAAPPTPVQATLGTPTAAAAPAPPPVKRKPSRESWLGNHGRDWLKGR